VFSPGEAFFEDVGPKVHADFEPLIAEAGIEVAVAQTLERIEDDAVVFADDERWDSALTIVIPPYRGHPAVVASEGLGDEQGFVPTDTTMRHLDFPEVFAAGDGSAWAKPKLGRLAVHQAEIAAAAIRREVTGTGEVPAWQPEVFCITNRGGGRATLILSDWLWGGERDLTFSSPLARLMEWGFDEYSFHTRGHLPPEAAQEALKKLFA